MKKTFIITFLIIGTVLFAGCTNETEPTTTIDTTTSIESQELEEINPSEVVERPMDGQQGRPQGISDRPQLDLTEAAQTLGVTVEALETALGTSEGTQPPSPEELESVAEELGVTIEEIQEALGAPLEGGRPEGQRPEGGPQGAPLTE